MAEALRPAGESERLIALAGLKIMDTPPEERFDRITRTAARLFKVPIAIISLIDAEREWLKSSHGFDVREIARDQSFCAHVVRAGAPLVLPDAAGDDRFAANPHVVHEPGIRFYAAQPLRSPDGYVLGALCIADYKPRRFSSADLRSLRDLADWTENELDGHDLNRALVTQQATERALAESEERFRQFAENINDVFWMLSPDQSRVLYVSPAYETVWGRTPASLYERPSSFTDPIHFDDVARVRQARKTMLSGDYDVEYRIVRPDGAVRWIWSRAFPVRNDQGEIYRIAGISKDITERKLTEEAMARLASIVESSDDAIIAKDLAGTIVSWNSGAERLFGYKAEEAVGRPISIIMPESRPDEIPQMLMVIRSGRRLAHYETTRVTKDGRQIAVDLAISPIKDSGGAIIGASTIAHDITARKEAEKQILLYADIVKYMHSGLFVYRLEQFDDDRTLRLIATNPSATEFTGISDAVGKTIDEVFPELRGRGITLAYARVARTGEAFEMEDVYYDDGGEVTGAFSIKAFPLPDQCVGVSFENITERKRAEIELQRQYRKADHARSEMRAILDAAGEGMALVGPDRRFRTVNRSFLTLFGVTAARILGQRFDELQGLIDQVFVDPGAFRKQVAGSVDDTAQDFTTIVQQSAPAQRELSLYSTPVHSENDEYLGRLYALRDVTREREVDRMKSEFVSLVSHELRTPLTSIKGFVDLLLEGEVGDIGEEQREFLEIVKSNADRLVKLINDLLDISRIEAGRVELQRVPLDFSALALGVVASLRPQLESKSQQLLVELDPSLPSVLGNADRVNQILTNLLSNAHKYTPRGGHITLRTQQVDEFLQVDVEDTGVGLSPEEQTQIFTKFFRAKNRATQEASGTGLGLAITRSLVEMHGGQIGVSSTPGVGTVFSFTLPITERAIAPSARPSSRAPGGQVLVVDDEPDIVNLLRRYLERAGYNVVSAYAARDALRLAQEVQPDLIILDLLLPDTDGLTLLEWLKNDLQTRQIPVVLLSIMADNGRGRMLGAVDYLTKPVNEQFLLDRVGRILEGDRRRVVLVVDDEPDTRRLLVGHLRRAGYEVLEAADGEQAISATKRDQPSLVLMDIRMPGMDGIRALQSLKSDPSTQGVPVVMMTASPGAFEESASTVEALGGTTLLKKPCTPEELAAAIARGLERKD